MADRLLALAGVGRGPTLRTARMKKPTLCIRSLSEDFTVRVRQGDTVATFDKPGRHELPESDWMQVEGEGNCTTLICTIQEGK